MILFSVRALSISFFVFQFFVCPFLCLSSSFSFAFGGVLEVIVMTAVKVLLEKVVESNETGEARTK
jgi:hypothetical protein